MSGNTFDISKAPATLNAVAFAKRKPKNDNDGGASVKRLTFLIDASREGVMERIAPVFAGLIDEHMGQRVAREQGSGGDLVLKRKLGVCLVQVFDPQGDLLFESKTARVDKPKLVVNKEAKSTWLVIKAELAVPKKALSSLDDYFRCDVLVSLANSQLDLEDQAKGAAQAADAVADKKAKIAEEKAAKGTKNGKAPKSPKASKKDGVAWTKREAEPAQA